MTTASWSIVLPTPPSVNAMYVNRSSKGAKGRMISPVYVRWRAEAEASLWKQKPLRMFKGRVAVCMEFQLPKGLADLDGKLKPVLDFLVRHEIIEEDNYKFVRMILATWDENVVGCKVTVTDAN